VNAIIGLGEEIKEFVIVQKVLRTLPMIFSALEERSDLNSISMDELHAIFTLYEMKTEQENSDVKKKSLQRIQKIKEKEKGTRRI
jgi:hypothetical protein